MLSETDLYRRLGIDPDCGIIVVESVGALEHYVDIYVTSQGMEAMTNPTGSINRKLGDYESLVGEDIICDLKAQTMHPTHFTAVVTQKYLEGYRDRERLLLNQEKLKHKKTIVLDGTKIAIFENTTQYL